jgi:hypothetical protein
MKSYLGTCCAFELIFIIFQASNIPKPKFNRNNAKSHNSWANPLADISNSQK